MCLDLVNAFPIQVEFFTKLPEIKYYAGGCLMKVYPEDCTVIINTMQALLRRNNKDRILIRCKEELNA